MRIDDLKETLRDHAGGSFDAGLAERTTAVRHRVRAVRRRRMGSVAAVAAAAVLAVPVLNALDQVDPVEAAGRDLAGREAPATMVANGFTYEFDYGVEGDAADPLKLRLRRDDSPRLVSWTVTGDEAQGRLTDLEWADEDTRSWLGGGDGFDRYDFIAPGVSTRLKLARTAGSGEGKLAMAVYRLSDEPADGVSANGVTFRDEVAGAPLIGAKFGEPGEAEISFDIEVPEGRLMLSDLCTAGESFSMRISVEGGDGYDASSCGSEPWYDEAGAGSTTTALAGTKRADGRRFEAGQTVRITAALYDEKGDGPVSVPDATIGLAAYARPDGTRIGDDVVEDVIERDGHTWQLVDLDVSEPGAVALRTDVGPVQKPVRVEVSTTNDGSLVKWDTIVDGESWGVGFSGPSGSQVPAQDIQLNEGQSTRVELKGVRGVDDSLRFSIATYELVR